MVAAQDNILVDWVMEIAVTIMIVQAIYPVGKGTAPGEVVMTVVRLQVRGHLARICQLLTLHPPHCSLSCWISSLVWIDRRAPSPPPPPDELTN